MRVERLDRTRDAVAELLLRSQPLDLVVGQQRTRVRRLRRDSAAGKGCSNGGDCRSQHQREGQTASGQRMTKNPCGRLHRRIVLQRQLRMHVLS